MSMQLILEIILTVLLIGLGYYAYKKFKKKKDKKKNPVVKSEKPSNNFGFKTEFAGMPELKPIFISVMRVIKSKDPALYVDMGKTINVYRALNKDVGKNILGQAWKKSGLIQSYKPLLKVMKLPGFRKVKIDFYMDHLIHEYLHLKGYKHGVVMNAKKTLLITSLGGKVNRIT